MHHPPHLPPPACNVETHHKLRSLSGVLFTVFISGLSGVTAALAAIAWVVPLVLPADSFTRVQNVTKRPADVSVDPLLVQQTRQRQIQIFDTRQKVRGSYYPDGAQIAEGVFLSSDGWAVVPAGAGELPDVSVWEGIDAQGVTHKVLRSVRTPEAVYARFDGSGFRIMPFAPWNNVDVGTTMWSVVQSEWNSVTIESAQKTTPAGSVSPITPAARFAFLPSAPKKSILVNEDGEFVGFGEDSEIRIPSWRVDYELRSILNGGKITYRSFPWKGFFISRADDGRGLREASGFYVENVDVKSTADGVQEGDLVVQIDNAPVTAMDLERHILFAPEATILRVVRGGQEIEVMAKKSEVPPERK